MHLQLDGSGPLYDQIYRALRHRVDTGALRPGERIPGSRALARDLAVSRNSVLTALHMLEVEGYVETRRRAGTYVCPGPRDQRPDVPPAAVPLEAAVTPPDRIAAAVRFRLAEWMARQPSVRYDFRYGRVTFPPASWRTWTRIHARQLRRRERPVLAFDFQGEPALRRALSEHLGRNRGIRCRPEDVVITSGAQESIHLAMTAVLAPGDRVAMEEPGYLPARAVAALCGAGVEPVAVDDNGLCIEELESSPEPVRLVFVTPSHQFPTGAVLSAGRRMALYAWARRHGALIFEDDYDSEFRYDVRPLPALKSLDEDGRVLHAGSFSKTLFSGVRLGFLVLPGALAGVVRELKGCTSGPAPTFMQRAVAELLESGEYQRHLNRARKIYAERRAALLESLERRLAGAARWTGSRGGIHVYLTPERALPAAGLVRAAEAAGLGVTPIPSADGRRSSLALGYGGIEAGDIDAGVAVLASVLGS